MTGQGYSARRHNGKILTIIIAGHAAALTALALVKMDVVRLAPNTPLITRNIPIEPPPPVEPPPPERRVDAAPPQDRSALTLPKPIVPVPSDGPVVQPSPIEDVIFTPGPIGPVDIPKIAIEPRVVPEIPTPQPRQTPTKARPRGDPARWVTNDDYPAAALREEEQGRTAFRLAIAADGKPTACTVTGSSGSTVLDNAACRLLMRRARFVAGTDADGVATAGSYANSFLWQIPTD